MSSPIQSVDPEQQQRSRELTYILNQAKYIQPLPPILSSGYGTGLLFNLLENVEYFFERMYSLIRPDPDVKVLEKKEDYVKLTKSLHHRHWWVRRDAFDALCRLQRIASLEALLGCLGDPKLNELRPQRLLALVRIAAKTPNVLIDLLGSMLRTARNVEDLCAPLNDILQLLAELNTRDATITLIHILEHPNAKFRSAAVSAFRRLRDPSTVGPLVALLRSGDQISSSAVIYTLASIHNAEAVEGLVAAMANSAETVQWEIITALSEQGVGDFRMVSPLFTLLGRNTRLREQSKHLLIPYESFLGKYAHLVKHIFLSTELAKSDKAVKRLCSIKTPIADNLLHLVARRPAVLLEEKEYKSQGNTLRFDWQRRRAKLELVRRGKPPYDPNFYSDIGAFMRI